MSIYTTSLDALRAADSLPPKKRKRIADCEEEHMPEPGFAPSLEKAHELEAGRLATTLADDEALARALQAAENAAVGVPSERSLKRSERRAAKKQRL